MSKDKNLAARCRFETFHHEIVALAWPKSPTLAMMYTPLAYNNRSLPHELLLVWVSIHSERPSKTTFLARAVQILRIGRLDSSLLVMQKTCWGSLVETCCLD